MINEGKGISDGIKDDVEKIYKLFLKKSFSTNIYRFESRDLIIKFNKINNYNSDIRIDKYNNITINIGIPINGKEKRIKENITHELTHVMEILGLGMDKEYPKYNHIKRSLIEFKDYPMSKAMEFLTDVFYKTLDNEVKDQALIRLKELENYKKYDSIIKIKYI
jgi:hypothetical protein